jgi:hypothetical protein
MNMAELELTVLSHSYNNIAVALLQHKLIGSRCFIIHRIHVQKAYIITVWCRPVSLQNPVAATAAKKLMLHLACAGVTLPRFEICH